MANVISLRNVNKVYGTDIKTQVLFDINLDFEESSFNSIIGQSGSGKSTLLNIIGTLDKPTSGEVFINGTKTTQLSKDELAKVRNESIGFVFQFHYLLPEFTAYENIIMPYRIKNDTIPAEVHERAAELIHLMGLDKVKNNPATKMSGGQQQRTSIARALINNPRIILADEPTGNLDSDTTEKVYDLMRNINEKFRTMFLIITHDPRIAQKTDRILEILDGRINLDLENKAPGK
ncbi:MAG: ABC transporter ATP-binding protein [Anaerolineaceae bacterium]|jgi:lipoprotein-releasing system ATP-binding protein|nr:ABC transporter ATP-binding protein [Anaerolineaceae bacterium]MDD4041978.1 ABC transporter ATP-binding protein [Anaerolineaceae bacterium]MDD4577443.1 ABC transporter ATP-binding protein [Anaerolineaceae bacterium]